ncbi:alpha/beta fold hydrolase [Pyxidicoccus xibeiensis]|uniref:alpha/beta fold hydrolase n=1 Tax=Pyxidicoccus xibeiensis TaxID=2906759 RepID=UPI0020A7BB27|nr:alpha/beta hydrolase [Pyxidicoccus xibeiensis]MCP3138577.1 alpha/beta fold hydrolase [Pyxidicoccus xibeiensis]
MQQLDLVRLGLSVLAAVAPSVAGRVATDLFSRSRHTQKPVTAGAPLGAQVLPLRNGASVVKQAYVWGKGPTVLLVHGWGADSSSLYSMARPLSQQGFRVVAFDAPAHGASPGNLTTMTEFVTAVGGVMDELGELHAVVSHSLGGLATVAALSRDLGRQPRHLILLSVPTNLPELMEGFAANHLRLKPSVLPYMRGELLRRNGVPVEHWDIRTLGPVLRVPTLIIHDVEDSMVSFRQAELIHQVFAGRSHVEPTRGLGHRNILLDAEVRKRILHFVRAAEAAA